MAEFCQRAGGRSHVWPRRRSEDPNSKFPTIVYTGRFKALWELDAMAWLASPHAATRSARDPN